MIIIIKYIFTFAFAKIFTAAQDLTSTKPLFTHSHLIVEHFLWQHYILREVHFHGKEGDSGIIYVNI